jgi:hypothetical protein
VWNSATARTGVPRRTHNWDHDHCEFWWAKFAVEERPGIVHEGYCPLDGYRWICSTCFDNFKERFDWRVVAAGTGDV